MTDDTTLRELAELVQRMREAQRRYFRDRTYDNMSVSMKLEREVDALVADVWERQGKLF